MQSQMIGMQSSLDRILGTLQSNSLSLPQPFSPENTAASSSSAIPEGSMFPQQASPQRTDMGGQYPQLSIPNTPVGGSTFFPPPPHPLPSSSSLPQQTMDGTSGGSRPKKFPPLPGFAPPPHKFATYGIVPSTAVSSDDESEDTLPRASLNAPIEALQGLANAAAEAVATPQSSHRMQVHRQGNRMFRAICADGLPADYFSAKKRRRVELTPANAFPNVLDKVGENSEVWSTKSPKSDVVCFLRGWSPRQKLENSTLSSFLDATSSFPCSTPHMILSRACENGRPSALTRSLRLRVKSELVQVGALVIFCPQICAYPDVTQGRRLPPFIAAWKKHKVCRYEGAAVGNWLMAL